MEKPIFSQHLSASLASSFILLISPLVATCRRHGIPNLWMRTGGGVSRQRLGLVEDWFIDVYCGLLFLDIFGKFMGLSLLLLLFMAYFFHGISMDILGYELDDNEILDVEPDVVMHKWGRN